MLTWVDLCSKSTRHRTGSWVGLCAGQAVSGWGYRGVLRTEDPSTATPDLRTHKPTCSQIERHCPLSAFGKT